VSERWTFPWLDAQQRRVSLVPIVRIRFGLGDRYFTPVDASTLVPVGVSYDADRIFDADVYFDGGIAALARSGRLLALTNLRESAKAFNAEILASYGQQERNAVSFQLDNEDKFFSKILGQEYLLHRPVQIYLTFAGLDLAFAMSRFLGRVVRADLSADMLAIDAEAL
jgi:hypothetical protein